MKVKLACTRAVPEMDLVVLIKAEATHMTQSKEETHSQFHKMTSSSNSRIRRSYVKCKKGKRTSG